MRYTSLLVAIALALAVVGSASAGDVAWSNASGSNARFNWQQGKSGEGLWGNPTVQPPPSTAPPGFYFNNVLPTFKAEATYPGSQATLSTMGVTINNTLNGGRPAITELHIREWGTFTGDVLDVNQTYGSLAVTMINPSGGIKPLGNLNFYYNPVAGTWFAWKDVDLTTLSPSGLTIFGIAVTNHLKAIPDDVGATTAMIKKEGAEVILPEPATLLLGLCGLAVIAVRRAR